MALGPQGRWHLLSTGEADHPFGGLRHSEDDPAARDEQLGVLDLDRHHAEAAGDAERAQSLLDAMNALWEPEWTKVRRMHAAAAGKTAWPADLVWVQDDGPRRWPPFVHTLDAVDFVDRRAETELARLLPAGSWFTIDARLRDRAGRDVTSHRLLVVSAAVRVREWESPEVDEWGGHEIVTAVAGDERRNPAPLARALGHDGLGGLMLHPDHVEAVRASRVLRLEWTPVPWEADIAADVQAWILQGPGR